MKKNFFFLFVALFMLQTSFSQVCPPNLDFESGNFDNWECFVGNTREANNKNIISLSPTPPLAGRHQIISSTTAKDVYGNFPQLCPYGGNYSVKLGNNGSGGEAEGLSYTFQVPATVDTFSFTYFYAVVFQDPKHAASQQPRFFVTAYDVATGEPINCASYDYIATGGIPGFKVSPVQPDVLYKEWSPVSIQFAGLANRTVRLEFKTADCTQGGHFGYAYIDVGSGCSNILATAPYCIETNSIILNAPYGFKTYTWYNEDYSAVIGNQQSLTLSPPPATSGIFHVDIVPYPGYGCRDTAQAFVTPLPVPDTPVAQSQYFLCQFQKASPLTATAQPGNDLIWYATAQGGAGSATAPIPGTSVAGEFTYYVAQKKLFGCESLRKKIIVTINVTPIASFTINKDKQCAKGNEFVFTSTSTHTNNSSYTWNFGDGKTLSTTDSIVTYTYSNYGSFAPKLTVQNAPSCFTLTSGAVTVFPNPVAAFSYPPLICEQETLVQLQNKSTVPGNFNQLKKWWWSIDGAVSQSQSPASFLAQNPGKLSVRLAVTTDQGCTSDTNTTVLDVRYQPQPSFAVSGPLCNNETILFNNRSALPPGAAQESIAAWSWKLNTTGISTGKDLALHLPAGLHRIQLTAISNYGCTGGFADSIMIYSKPNVVLEITDSCVRRAIQFKATDPFNAVTQWTWDFGSGFKEGNATVTRSYSMEGDRPVALIGKTIDGCRDTLLRPFRIYENKAFAGRDTTTAMNEPVQLNAQGGPGVSYTWSPSLGLSSTKIENPIALWDRDQLYKLDAITQEGCDSHSQILIKRYKGPDIYIPNAFTPNGDGKNDLLQVFAVGISAFHFLTIYDRWGEMVYKTTDQLKGWDGTYKGRKLDTGVFIVVAQAVDYKGRMMVKKESVTLIR